MTNLRLGLMLLPLTLGLLAGCSGSSDDSEDGPTGFDAVEARADRLVNEIQDLGYTDPASLPTSGAATYEGVVGLDLASVPNETLQGQDVAGDLELTVNFASAGDQVTGTASDFVGVDDADWDGTLIIDDGSLDRSAEPGAEPVFTAEMAGVITSEDGTDWTVDTGLTGSFAGDDHSHVLGTVDGSACAASDCTVVDGGFVGER